MRVSRPISSTSRGFSLVELLLVMTVIVILIAVAGPALRGLLGSDNRKAAVNQLMGALEQARSTALEKGVPISIGFVSTGFPEPSWSFTRYIIFRDRSADLGDAPTGSVQVMLSKWQALPVGVVLANFGNLPGGITPTNFQFSDGFPPITTPAGAASTTGTLPLCVLRFNSAGAVSDPAGGNLLSGANASGFFLTQGFYTANGLQETRRPSSGTKLQYDRITLARYTGRARFDPIVDPR